MRLCSSFKTTIVAPGTSRWSAIMLINESALHGYHQRIVFGDVFQNFQRHAYCSKIASNLHFVNSITRESGYNRRMSCISAMLVNSSGPNLERATICSMQRQFQFSDGRGFQFKHVRAQQFIQPMGIAALHQRIAFDLRKFLHRVGHIEMPRDFQRLNLDIDRHKPKIGDEAKRRPIHVRRDRQPSDRTSHARSHLPAIRRRKSAAVAFRGE